MSFFPTEKVYLYGLYDDSGELYAIKAGHTRQLLKERRIQDESNFNFRYQFRLITAKKVERSWFLEKSLHAYFKAFRMRVAKRFGYSRECYSPDIKDEMIAYINAL